MTHDITVCIPTHPGREPRLAKALASVLRQTYQVQAIVVETDHDAEGAAQTRNRALFKATTEWVAFLDSDDEMYPFHLEHLAAHQAETGADLCYPWFDLMYLDTEIRNQNDPLRMFGQPYDAAKLDACNYIPITYLVRRDLAVKVGGYPHLMSERWPHDNCEDWGFLRDFRDAGGTMSHLPERSWIWNHWGGNTSGKPWRAPTGSDFTATEAEVRARVGSGD